MNIQNSPQLLDVVAQYAEFHIKSKRLKKRTELNYLSYQSALKESLESLNLYRMSIADVSVPVMEDVKIYLLSNGRGQTNASRTIEVVKSAMDWAKGRGMILSNVISEFKPSRDPVKDVVHLEKSEQESWLLKQFEDISMEVARDRYLFQCETGMSYGDIGSYRIIKDEHGEWIYNKRNKNDKEYWVPLSMTAKMLHKKYNGKFPKMTNGDYNEAIRKIGESIGITKHLTSHTARKTFATRMYEEGWSLESIADMMGISIFVLTRHYIKKSRRRLEMEVKQRQSA